jgi:hypothetical protein
MAKTQITVTVTAQRSIMRHDGLWEKRAVSLTETREVSPKDAAGQRAELFEYLAGEAELHLDDFLPTNPVNNVFPETAQEAGEYVEPDRSAPVAAPPQTQQQAGQLDPGAELQYAPKAADRVPGTWWQTTCTHYNLIPGGESGPNKLEFWNEDRQYPEGYLSEKSPKWPQKWVEHMQFGKNSFAKPVLLVQAVSSKQNKNGAYFVDVHSLSVPKA